MRYLHLTALSLATCAAVVLFTGCGSSVMNNAMAGSAPTVSATGVEANGVAPNRWLYVQFNQAMDASTINSQTVTLTDTSGRGVTGNVAYYSNFDVAGFQPNPALQSGTTYTLTVGTGVKSARGSALQSDFKYNFTIRADTDKSPIGIKTVTPANGASCVSATALMTIEFTEGADVSTLTSQNIVVTGPGNTVIPATIGYNVGDAQATISPNAALPSGAITVTVNHVADAAGIAMTTPFTWSFSTSCSSGGGGSGGPATTQYMAPIYSDIGPSVTSGQITVDTQGMVNIQMTGATASTTYTVQFCEAEYPFSSNLPTSCMDITSISTNASGSASTSVKFPQPGNWAGDFVFNDSAGKQHYQTYLPSTAANATYMATLLPDNNTNNGAVADGTPQEPLSSGTVTVTGGTVTFAVKGAEPSTFYTGNESETTFLDGSGTYVVASLTTDAQGNGSGSGQISGTNGGDMFQLEPQYKGAGYIGGFAVPR